jgi:small subunit ribosomal protein S17
MTDTPSAPEAKSTVTPGDTPAPPGTRPNRRKTRDGTVVSAKMDKTVIVSVIERVRHARYQKTLQRTKRLYAHDEQNDVKEGDRVRVQETRPLSRTKRWRVVEVLERAR